MTKTLEDFETMWDRKNPSWPVLYVGVGTRWYEYLVTDEQTHHIIDTGHPLTFEQYTLALDAGSAEYAAEQMRS